jgi:hypothetical protein
MLPRTGQRAERKAQNKKASRFYWCLLPRAYGLFSSNHPIRPGQHIWWNREANLVCRLEIDYRLKLCRLLDRQIGRFSPRQYLIHKNRYAANSSAKSGP